LLVFPSQIIPVVGIGLLISAFLIFIARPLSVMISLIPFHLQNRHRWFISWVGLRGAVPIVFATYPLLAGAEKAQMIFNVVFFISLSSVLIQGSTLHLVARWLHLTLPEGLKQRSPHDMELVESTKSILTQTVLPGTCEMAGKPIVQAGLPLSTTITMIKRNDKYLIPDGSTVLQPGDTLFLLSENTDSLNEALECLNIQE
jgi:cell volume regulation protein A